MVDLIKGNSPIPESNLQIQAARTPEGHVAKGQSGKPLGCRSHASRAAETLLDAEAETLTGKVREFALDGDPTAMRLCFERIVAPGDGRSGPPRAPR